LQLARGSADAADEKARRIIIYLGRNIVVAMIHSPSDSRAWFWATATRRRHSLFEGNGSAEGGAELFLGGVSLADAGMRPGWYFSGNAGGQVELPRVGAPFPARVH